MGYFSGLFCSHKETKFIRNIFGDEINRLDARSLHRCRKCGTVIKSWELHGLDARLGTNYGKLISALQELVDDSEDRVVLQKGDAVKILQALEYAEVPECFKELLANVNGLSHGTDWNKGTHAGIYREKLLQSAKNCEAHLNG